MKLLLAISVPRIISSPQGRMTLPLWNHLACDVAKNKSEGKEWVQGRPWEWRRLLMWFIPAIICCLSKTSKTSLWFSNTRRSDSPRTFLRQSLSLSEESPVLTPSSFWISADPEHRANHSSPHCTETGKGKEMLRSLYFLNTSAEIARPGPKYSINKGFNSQWMIRERKAHLRTSFHFTKKSRKNCWHWHYVLLV